MVNSVADIANTPLQQREVVLAGGHLREAALTLKFSLRGDSSDQRFMQAVNGLLGNAGAGDLQIPVVPNTISAGGQSTIFWMGPDEWLLRCEPQATQILSSALSEDAFASAFSGLHAAAVDVSDYYTVFELHSADAMGLLARSCPLDLEKEFAEPGRCAQTRIGNAAVLLDANGTDKWRVQARWSYAQYLWQILERSALSF